MLGKLVGEVERPFVAVVGGANVAEKMGLLDSLLPRADTICLGGAMANTFLCAKGFAMGRSLVEPSKLPIARAFLAKAESSDVQVLLPRDLVAAHDLKAASGTVFPSAQVPGDHAALDIGPESLSEIASVLNHARSVFWNGPMGAYETPAFAAGSLGVAKALALVIGGTTIVAGHDTATTVERAGVASSLTHVSTGGAAALEFIEGKRLPGLAVLES
jgi:phosphoglycerate kinase